MNLQSSMNSLLAMTMGATAYTSQMKSKQLQQQKQDKFNEDKLSAIQEKTTAVKESTKKSVVEKAQQLMQQQLAEARKLRGIQKESIQQKLRQKYMDPNVSGDTGTYYD